MSTVPEIDRNIEAALNEANKYLETMPDRDVLEKQHQARMSERAEVEAAQKQLMKLLGYDEMVKPADEGYELTTTRGVGGTWSR